jgi:uncharacterized protein (TIGR03086 family)
MATLERYRSVADGFSVRLAGVGADQWSLPTPCTDWTVLDLAAHVIGTHRGVLCSLEGGEPAAVDKEGDLTPEWRRASQAVIDALADEAKAGTIVGGMFGEQTFESLVGRLLCADTLVHSWDLARATGQDELLDPVAVAACAEFLKPIDEAIRRPGGFAPKIDPPSGADEQTQLLCFCGRAV